MSNQFIKLENTSGYTITVNKNHIVYCEEEKHNKQISNISLGAGGVLQVACTIEQLCIKLEEQK